MQRPRIIDRLNDAELDRRRTSAHLRHVNCGWPLNEFLERNGRGADEEDVISSSQGPEQRPVTPARQARQGVTGHNGRFVLGFSVAAVVIAFAIIWMLYFA